MAEQQAPGPPPGPDIPLTLGRLTPEELAAATAAAAQLVASRHRDPISVVVTWLPSPAGEDWYVTVPSAVSYEPAEQATALLLPIVRQIRPRALKYEYLAPIDQFTAWDIGAIGMAGTMPSASAYVKRWAENRTVATAHAAQAPDPETLDAARATLAACRRALGLAPPADA